MNALTRVLSALIFFCVAAAKADQTIALPSGAQLRAEPRALRLLDAQGHEQARLDVRAKQLDARPWPGEPDALLAVVFDTDQQQPLLLKALARNGAGSLQIVHRFAPLAFSLESQCLYRDAQQLDHLFLIANDGLAEQWLLTGATPQALTPRLLRRLALPPNAEHCQGDDAQGLLHVREEGVGLWAYAADGEGIPRRQLLGGTRLLSPNPKALKDLQGLTVTPLPFVTAQAQTESVAQRGDAADDPAIWVHPADATRSRIFGTNKKQGLLAYDLQGRQTQLIEAGRLNNVDIRQNLLLGGAPVDLAIATQRDENALAIFEIDAQGHARDAARIPTTLDDIYGMCLYRTPQGGLEVFANDKSGRFEQIRVTRSTGAYGSHGAAYKGELLRSFKALSQPEGCVVDDAQGRLFYGEEDVGIWTLPAAANAKDKPKLILEVGPLLVADVEGLAIYKGKSASYLIASSQGNSSYVVLDAQPPFKALGAFRIGINAAANIDGTSDTDGIDVSPVNFGGAYDEGLFVVQDGYKHLPDGAQNFKYVAWRDIARALKLK